MKSKRKKIDWLNHSLEFIVVIIGILLAFQLNRCSTDRSLEETVNIHINQIREETLLNKRSLEKAIKSSESSIAKFDSIIGLIRRKEDFTSINRLSMELLNINNVYIRKNAYLTLTETGDIKYIKSFKQKEDIINLYEYYRWVESFNEISANIYVNDFYPYLRDNFDLIQASVQEDSIYLSKKYQNILGAYYRTSLNRLNKYKDCLREMNEYLGENTKTTQ